MKKPLIASAAFAVLMTVAAAGAEAQQRSPPFGARTVPPGHGGRFHGGHFKRHRFPAFLLVERAPPVIIEREVVPLRQAQDDRVQKEPPPAPPPARKPYVVGKTYASLPGGCMKLIEGGASYYYCGGGEWYRLVGKQYRAVAKP
jgi:hypothetical protein